MFITLRTFYGMWDATHGSLGDMEEPTRIPLDWQAQLSDQEEYPEPVLGTTDTTIRPRDLPRLRDQLVAFGERDLFNVLADIFQTDPASGLDRRVLANSMRAALAMSQAELFFIESEMCELAFVASRSLPEFTLTPADPPSPDGFVWLATSIMDVDPERVPAQVTGIGWRTLQDTLQVAIFVHRDRMSPGDAAVLRQVNFPIVFPLGAWEIPIEPDGEYMTIRQHGPDRTRDHKGRTTGVTSLAVLKTLWLLAKQPLAREESVLADRTARRQAAREGRREPPPVRVIQLRRPAGSGHGGGGGGHTEWHHQWIVRGHWRNQAYGTDRKLRRPVWIAPFVKGPEGAPMIGGEKVYVMKGDKE